MRPSDAELVALLNEASLHIEDYVAQYRSQESDADHALSADLFFRLRTAADALAGEGSDGFTEDEACEDCGNRRATMHLEGPVNELCAECHIARLERIVNGPVGEMRRLLAAFVQRVGGKCRLDADGYCQGHFLERGDQCTVKLAREELSINATEVRDGPSSKDSRRLDALLVRGICTYGGARVSTVEELDHAIDAARSTPATPEKDR